MEFACLWTQMRLPPALNRPATNLTVRNSISPSSARHRQLSAASCTCSFAALAIPARLLSCTLLPAAEHMLLDATDWRNELAPELHTLAGLLDMADSLQTDRIL